jgi:hypothetical protein
MLLDPPGRATRPRPDGLHLPAGQPTFDLTPAPLPERRRLAREARVALGCALGLLLLALLAKACVPQTRAAERPPDLSRELSDLDRAGARLVAFRLDEAFFVAVQRHREGKP